MDGGITRLMAVFQSSTPDKVGGLRSVRPTDHTLVQPLHGVFAFSGGNQIELDSIQGAPARQLDEDRAGPMMFRDPNGHAPNNLYARVDQMSRSCHTGAPRPLFAFRSKGTAATGSPVRSMTVHYQSPYDVTWTWSAKSRTWLRTRFGAPDILADGHRVQAANVVVLSIPYSPNPDVPDGRGVIDGSGPAEVFSAGRVTRGTWSRTDQNQPPKLLDGKGHEIALTPGQTWVELPDRSYPITTESLTGIADAPASAAMRTRARSSPSEGSRRESPIDQGSASTDGSGPPGPW